MTSELMTRASSVEVFRKKGGDITFPRFSVLHGVRLVMELAADKNITYVSMDDFCRPFHGVSCASTRKRAKPQVRNVIKAFIEDRKLAMPQYGADGQLVGLVYIKDITDDNQEEVLSMVADCAKKAQRRKDLGTVHLQRLDAIVSQLLPEA